MRYRSFFRRCHSRTGAARAGAGEPPSEAPLRPADDLPAPAQVLLRSQKDAPRARTADEAAAEQKGGGTEGKTARNVRTVEKTACALSMDAVQ